jgi:Fuc2NAc and GlcNAc transferase
MAYEGVLLAAAVFVFSLAGTFIVRHFAPLFGLLDKPNSRSSHVVPTPRGGGLAILLSMIIGLGFVAWEFSYNVWQTAALLSGLVIVGVVGFVDDRSSVTPARRLAIHFAGVCLVVVSCDFARLLGQFDSSSVVVMAALVTCLILAGVWCLNLVNFMDGIDGLAAAQAAFVGVAGAALCSWFDSGAISVAVWLVIASAAMGFLVLNWSPASVFMGDVGSGTLGVAIFFASVFASVHDEQTAWAWPILMGSFLCDSTVTLASRVVSGNSPTSAHRTHAYQILAREWASHRLVAYAFAGVNAVWLLPWAVFSIQRPDLAPLAVVLALAPLAAIVLWIRAAFVRQL